MVALFIVIALAIAGTGAFAFLVIKRRRERASLSSEEMLARFCVGDKFDLNGLLRFYHVRVYLQFSSEEVWHYVILLEKNRVKLLMRKVKSCLILEDIKRYYDTNAQFTGWYDDYDRSKDRSSAKYIVIGMDWDEAVKRHGLPSFKLSRRAIDMILSELKRGVG